MWLLDVNLPGEVATVLAGFGIAAQHSRVRGWDTLTNGLLVEAAWGSGFDVVLTRDKLFGESAARALEKFPGFGVVLVTIPQARGREFLQLFQSAWVESPIQPLPGRLIKWPTRA